MGLLRSAGLLSGLGEGLKAFGANAQNYLNADMLQQRRDEMEERRLQLQLAANKEVALSQQAHAEKLQKGSQAFQREQDQVHAGQRLLEADLAVRRQEEAKLREWERAHDPVRLAIEAKTRELEYELGQPLADKQHTEKIRREIEELTALADNKGYRQAIRDLNEARLTEPERQAVRVTENKLKREEKVDTARDAYLTAVQSGNTEAIEKALVELEAVSGDPAEARRQRATLISKALHDNGLEITRLQANLDKNPDPDSPSYKTTQRELTERVADQTRYSRELQKYLNIAPEPKSTYHITDPGEKKGPAATPTPASDEAGYVEEKRKELLERQRTLKPDAPPPVTYSFPLTTPPTGMQGAAQAGGPPAPPEEGGYPINEGEEAAPAAPAPAAYQKPSLGPLGTEIVGQTAEGRPIVKNPDGTYSTERSITEQIDGQWMNIPSMYGGKEVPPDEAVEIIKQNNGVDPETGRKLPTYNSQAEAEQAAEARSTHDLGQYGHGSQAPAEPSALSRIGSAVAAPFRAFGEAVAAAPGAFIEGIKGLQPPPRKDYGYPSNEGPNRPDVRVETPPAPPPAAPPVQTAPAAPITDPAQPTTPPQTYSFPLTTPEAPPTSMMDAAAKPADTAYRAPDMEGPPRDPNVPKGAKAREKYFAPDIKRAASKYANVDELLLREVLRAESGFDPDAVGKTITHGKSKGKPAVGIAQFTEETAEEYGLTDRRDPHASIETSARYLSVLLKRYKGDETKALAAYNWGMRHVDKNEPFPRETQRYVTQIRSRVAMARRENRYASTGMMGAVSNY